MIEKRGMSYDRSVVEQYISDLNKLEKNYLIMWACFNHSALRSKIYTYATRSDLVLPSRFSMSSQKKLLDRFLDLGIVTGAYKTQKLTIYNQFYFYFLNQGIESGFLQRNKKAIWSFTDLIERRGYTMYEASEGTLFRSFVWQIYNGEPLQEKELQVFDGNMMLRGQCAIFNGLLRYFDQYGSGKVFPLVFFEKLLHRQLRLYMHNFGRAGREIEIASKLKRFSLDALADMSEDFVADCVFFHILRADFEMAERVASCNGAVKLLYDVVYSFLVGGEQAGEVVTRFEKAIGASCAGGFKKFKFSNYLHFFYYLSVGLLKNNPENYKKVLSSLSIKRGDDLDGLSHFAFCLRSILERKFYLELRRGYDDLQMEFGEALENFWGLVLVLIFKWREDLKLAKFMEADCMVTFFNKAELCGFKLICSEAVYISNVFAELENACDSFTPLEWGGFINRVEKIPKWEQTLLALENSFGGSSVQPTGSVGEKRLVWIIGRSEVEVKEQSLRKNGRWTKGRAVALSKLVSRSVESATEADYKVASKAIKDESYSWYGKPSYYLSDQLAILNLVGADNVYVEEKGNYVKTELTRGEIEFRTESVPGGTKISIFPSFRESGVHVVRHSISKHVVYDISKKDVSISSSIPASGLIVPEEQSNRIEKLLPLVSNRFAVHSDSLDATDLATVDVPAVVRVRLYPFSNGIHVEAVVGPCGDKEKFLSPGVGLKSFLGKQDGEKVQFVRDLEKEKETLANLFEVCPILVDSGDDELSWFISELEESLEVVSALYNVRDDFIIEWPEGETLSFAGSVDFNDLQLRVKSDNAWFELEGEANISDDAVVSARELLKPVEQHGRFIRMSDGRFVALTKKLSKELERAKAFVQEDKKSMRLHPASSLGFGDFLADTDVQACAEWRERVANVNKVGKKRYHTPPALQADLRDYQFEGYRWLNRLSDLGFGACLADDMGLGKTVQALSLLLKRKSKGAVLVVAPASVCENWFREIVKFTPSLNPLIFGNETDREKCVKKAKKGDVVITTYGLLNSASEIFTARKWGTVILDEAQMIKNHTAKRTKVAHSLSADFKLITTGTPIENNLLELWSLFEFINPGLLGSKNSFFEKYSKTVQESGDSAALKQLKNLVKPFILRRKKMDVLDDLPAKTEISLDIELSDHEQAVYEALREEAVSLVEGGEVENPQFLILAYLTKLRRACCHSSLVTKKKGGQSSKLEQMVELVEELKSGGHRVLIFSQFVDFLKLAAQELDSANLTYQYLDGSTPVKKRLSLVDKFQNGDGDAFLISLKAGGTGLNLTAADYVIHLDPWWNPASEDQASDRAHRIGQQRPVTVYRFVAKGTVEEKISRLHHEKRELSESILSGADMAAKLSVDEIINLLR